MATVSLSGLRAGQADARVSLSGLRVVAEQHATVSLSGVRVVSEQVPVVSGGWWLNVAGTPVALDLSRINVSSSYLVDAPPAVAQFTDDRFESLYTLASDRVTLLGRYTGNRVATSLDGGHTWTPRGSGFPLGLTGIRQLDNGELIVTTAVDTGEGEGGSIWVSTGWADDPDTATWDKKVTFTAPGAYASNSWGIDHYGSLVVVNEYGSKASPTDMARYCWLSQDSGDTWEQVFDLYTENGGIGVEAHMHGVCYDPWWGALWVSAGDVGGSWGVWVSLDLGQSWTRLTDTRKITTLIALPGCVLGVTDSASPNAVVRFLRAPDPADVVTQTAYVIDPGATLTHVGQYAHRDRTIPNPPTLLTAFTAATGPGLLLATYDGYDFVELWRDTDTYAGGGPVTVVGPLVDDSYLARVITPGGNSVLRFTERSSQGRVRATVSSFV